MTIRTGLDMAAKRCGATLHDGVGGSAHVGGQGMALLIGRKGVLEDRLERDERHRCLRTRGRRASSGGFVQYHANYPRCKRLVQPALSEVQRDNALDAPLPERDKVGQASLPGSLSNAAAYLSQSVQCMRPGEAYGPAPPW